MKRQKDPEEFVLFSNVVYFQAVCKQGIILPFLLLLLAGYQEHQTSVVLGLGSVIVEKAGTCAQRGGGWWLRPFPGVV